MPSEAKSSERRVLIVDRSKESREVLRTVLEHRGMQIVEAQHAQQGVRIVQEDCPEVIVIDAENTPQHSSVFEAIDGAQSETPTQLIVLGNIARSSNSVPGASIVAKPYHYGPLLRKIEQLLAVSGEQ